MTESVQERTGSALIWRGIQMASDKLINLARLLILASLLGPEDFGLLALAAIAVDIALRLTDTGMTPALIQRQDLRKEHYDVAFTIQLARAVLVASIVLVAAPYLARAFGDPRATGLMQILALRVALQGALNTRLADLHRELRFRTLAYFYLTEVVVSTVATITLVFSIGVWALAVGPCIGALVQLVLSFLVVRGAPRFSMERSALSDLFNFGQWVFLQGIVVIAGSSLLQLVIARELGVAELGLYYMAMRLAFLPSSISSELAGAVAFPVYARLKDQPNAPGRAMRTTLKCLAVAVIPAALMLAVLAPSIVETLLGSQWKGTEQLIAILAIVNILGMMGDVLSPMFLALGRPAATAVTAFVLYSLLGVLALTLIKPFGIIGAALAWVIAVSATQLVGLRMMSRLVERPFSGMGRSLLLIASVSALSTLSAWAVAEMAPNPAGLAAALALGGLVALIGTWKVDEFFKLGIAETLMMAFPALTTLRSRFTR